MFLSVFQFIGFPIGVLLLLIPIRFIRQRSLEYKFDYVAIISIGVIAVIFFMWSLYDLVN